jgi:hypothetical protein
LPLEINKMQVCIVEGLPDRADRAPLTTGQLEGLGGFWTVESEAVRSAESLLEQFASDSSIHAAVESLSNQKVILPRPLLCNLRSLGLFQRDLFKCFELRLVRAFSNQQRLDFSWAIRDDRSCIDAVDIIEARPAFKNRRMREYLRTMLRRHDPTGREGHGLWLGLDGLSVEGLQDFGSVRAYGHILVLPGQPIVAFMREILDALDEASTMSAYVYMQLIGAMCSVTDKGQPGVEEIDRRLQLLENELPLGQLQKRRSFIEAMAASVLTTYDPWVWRQRLSGLPIPL